MNCEYCRQTIESLLKISTASNCNHKFCQECALLLKRKNESKCPKDDNNIVLSLKSEPDICQSHGIKIMHFCYDHFEKACSSCSHKNCKGKFVFSSSTVDERLNKVYEDERNKVKSLKNIDIDLSSIQEFIEAYEQGIIEYEDIIGDLAGAKRSQSKRKKEKTLKTYSTITENLLSLEKDQRNLYEKILKPEETQLILPNYENEDTENTDMDFANQNQNPNSQASKEILEIYSKLGNNAIRLFFNNTILGEDKDGIFSYFFFDHDLADSVEISGAGIGKSVFSTGLVYIIDFEIIVEEKHKLQLKEVFYPCEEEGMIFDLKFDSFRLERNQACQVIIHVGGEFLNIFNMPNGGPVNIVDSDSQPFMTGCPILYFILDEPFK